MGEHINVDQMKPAAEVLMPPLVAVDEEGDQENPDLIHNKRCESGLKWRKESKFE